MSTVRVTLGGLVIGAQRWSVGHTLYTTDTPTGTQMAAIAEAALSLFKSNVWVGTGVAKLAPANSSFTTLDQARAYFYPPGATKATLVGNSTGAAVNGSVTSNGGAPQLAIVATLEDGLAGRNHKGRMYLPANCNLVSANTLQLSTSQAAGLAGSISDYFEAWINTNPVSSLVLSPVVSSLTAPRILSAVSVDTVVDTQRRRRDKIVGTRSRVPIVVG